MSARLDENTRAKIKQLDYLLADALRWPHYRRLLHLRLLLRLLIRVAV